MSLQTIEDQPTHLCREDVYRNSTVPPNGGWGSAYGVFEEPVWDPQAAAEANERAIKSQTQSDQLKVSLAKMAGAEMVRGSVFFFGRSMDHAEYADALAVEADMARKQVEFYGGQAAVAAFRSEPEPSAISA